MATYVKNATRYQPQDWYTSNYTVSTNAERQREASFQTRQESKFLSNETDIKTKWDQYDNNTRLADRVDEIRKWKEILEKSLADLDKEVRIAKCPWRTIKKIDHNIAVHMTPHNNHSVQIPWATLS